MKSTYKQHLLIQSDVLLKTIRVSCTTFEANCDEIRSLEDRAIRACSQGNSIFTYDVYCLIVIYFL